MKTDGEKPGSPRLISRVSAVLFRPSTHFSLVALLAAGVVVGILLWGGFHWTIELTNTETFCISCHEMKTTPYKELQETVHYTNRTGVRAICSDCHVPKQWFYKLRRKIQASNELFHHFAGTVNTPEKFEAERLTMALRVWAAMKDTDSRECRNCHQMQSMALEKQARPSQRMHRAGVEKGQTCIDCHKGIAHHLPKGWEDKSDGS